MQKNAWENELENLRAFRRKQIADFAVFHRDGLTISRAAGAIPEDVAALFLGSQREWFDDAERYLETMAETEKRRA